jgi:integrase
MGAQGIQPFTPHDLRRTFRSLLAENGVDPYTAERCLNHKIRGVAGMYDCHDYFKIRKEAMDVVAEQIIGLTPDFKH